MFILPFFICFSFILSFHSLLNPNNIVYDTDDKLHLSTFHGQGFGNLFSQGIYYLRIAVFHWFVYNQGRFLNAASGQGKSIMIQQDNNAQSTTAEEDISLWRFLDHTRYVISRSRELELAQFGLSPEQVYVLDILSVRGGSTTIGDIVDMTSRQHHTISTLVARMAKRGLVARKRSVKDRRSYDIVLTKNGNELFQKVTRHSIEMVFSTLTREEKQALNSILKQLLTTALGLSGKKFNFRATSVFDGR
jgi:DNA-binding MarR family transcriptional regulator